MHGSNKCFKQWENEHTISFLPAWKVIHSVLSRAIAVEAVMEISGYLLDFNRWTIKRDEMNCGRHVHNVTKGIALDKYT